MNNFTKVRVIGVTKPVVDFIPDHEDLISYVARISNEGNQLNFKTGGGLLSFCVRNSHWSIFEMVNLVMEIETPRDISRQILRHRTACFQEFSQRYAEVAEDKFIIREARLQDSKNRQNSVVTEDEKLISWWEGVQRKHIKSVVKDYQKALKMGIAKECARVILPEGLTMSRLYMNANMRTWLHYISVREGNGTQDEHIWLAKLCKQAVFAYYPALKDI